MQQMINLFEEQGQDGYRALMQEGDASYNSIKSTLGLVGSITVILLFTSPVKDIMVVIKNKNTDNLATSLPYFATFCNCFAWCCYTAPDFQNYVFPFLINLFGSILSIFYASTFWYYTDSANAKQCGIYTMVGASLLVVALILQIALGRVAMGYTAAVMNVVMLYAPLAAAQEVIATKSVQKYPFWPLIFAFLSSFVWTFYGVHTKDVPIFIPNVCGLVFGVIQLAIYARYRNWPTETGEGPDMTPIELGHEKLPSESSHV